jgi:hypothetical protein
VWEGDPNAPMSCNAWNYTNGNPVNRTDPSGFSAPPFYDPMWSEWVFYIRTNDLKLNERPGPNGTKEYSPNVPHTSQLDPRLLLEQNQYDFKIWYNVYKTNREDTCRLPSG